MRRPLALLGALLLLATAVSGCLFNEEDSPYNQGAVGDFKYEFLQADPYPKLIIELDFVAGNDIDPEAKSLLEQRIRQVTDKTSIEWVKESFSSSDTSYSQKDVLKLEEEQRDKYKGGDTAVIHLFYLNGKSAENENTAGYAYTGSSIVIFKENIKNAELGTNSATDVEKAVLVHEFGHLLGLVNIGYTSPVDHEDKDNPGHSNNEPGLFNDGSVMYYQVDSTNYWNQFKGEPANKFDSDDLDDLRLLKAGKL